jgi:hypothetical protein
LTRLILQYIDNGKRDLSNKWKKWKKWKNNDTNVSIAKGYTSI